MIRKQPRTSAAPGRFNLIANYGLSWKLSETEWESANKVLKAHRGLVGQRPGKRRANFWGQDGIYVLYRNHEVHYVGVSKRLGERLRTHTKDRHQDMWDEFDWYGFCKVTDRKDSNGFLTLEERLRLVKVKTWKVRADIEAVLGRTFAWPGEKMKPHFGAQGVEKWEQMPALAVAKYRERWEAAQTS